MHLYERFCRKIQLESIFCILKDCTLDFEFGQTMSISVNLYFYLSMFGDNLSENCQSMSIMPTSTLAMLILVDLLYFCRGLSILADLCWSLYTFELSELSHFVYLC